MGVSFSGGRGEPVVGSTGNPPTFSGDLTTISEFFAKRSLRRFTTLAGLLASAGVTPGDLAVADDTPGVLYQWDVSGWNALRLPIESSFTYVETVLFTSSGIFEKNDYPWVRAIEVRCVGAGGASGAAEATGSGQVSIGGPGCGGSYAEGFITDIASLSSSEAITVGTAGVGGTGPGGNGGDTSALGVIAEGGDGGGAGSGLALASSVPGAPGAAGSGTGDFVQPGSRGSVGFALQTNRLYRGTAGSSALSPILTDIVVSASTAGVAGLPYGGGGLGPVCAPSNARINGANGATGCVELRLFA